MILLLQGGVWSDTSSTRYNVILDLSFFTWPERATTPTRLTHFHQAIASVPASAHVAESRVDLGLGNLGVWTSQNRSRLVLCSFEQLPIADQACDLKTWHARLARAEKFPRSPQL